MTLVRAEWVGERPVLAETVENAPALAAFAGNDTADLLAAEPRLVDVAELAIGCAHAGWRARGHMGGSRANRRGAARAEADGDADDTAHRHEHGGRVGADGRGDATEVPPGVAGTGGRSGEPVAPGQALIRSRAFAEQASDLHLQHWIDHLLILGGP